ncbi:hypothetical protein HanPI659440_Chr14g0572751 [Helianthus annuus]|nr:hypothetical protein HanPI659440_Chr14g0572751 [Helianthus annuus]
MIKIQLAYLVYVLSIKLVVLLHGSCYTDLFLLVASSILPMFDRMSFYVLLLILN